MNYRERKDEGETEEGKQEENIFYCWIFGKMKDFRTSNLLEWKQTKRMNNSHTGQLSRVY